ncbi:hypothetical protein RND81_02G224100 [Saponaria officinalis]|uniref:GATA-type domain-containing protein n=1 Tax=Saponaria officinalis TaxID=3572 RepID=A0AAW1MWG0_SAPOF
MVETKMLEEIGNGKLFDHIDDLLDFENDDIDDGLFGCGEVDIDAFPPVWMEESPALFSGGRCNNRASRFENSTQLEWLSNFVQDSLSKPKTHPICHAKRARSKRPRPATFNPRAALRLIPPRYFPKPKKKQKIKCLCSSSSSDGEMQNQNSDPNTKPVRKCTHCEITQTPQWREGPDGPKTLCNACGVRYKSGRLFPEYRPAASPTFIPTVHSNSHRKVIEMRKCKNEAEIVKPELLQNSNSQIIGKNESNNEESTMTRATTSEE